MDIQVLAYLAYDAIGVDEVPAVIIKQRKRSVCSSLIRLCLTAADDANNTQTCDRVRLQQELQGQETVV